MRALAVFTAVLLVGCSREGHSTFRADEHEATVQVAASSAGVVAGETLVQVDGHEKLAEFFVRSRESKVEKFPCQRCHKLPLAQMKHDGKDGKTTAHWAVALKHADASVMNCSTCHFEGDLNSLRTLTNRPVKLDNGYQVCAQCHSKQASDWAGGAHGKRVTGWAPPRVVRSCVECHNPHAPAFAKRMPAMATAVAAE
jgi:hypothetical protein